jgi:8-amino-3,8-dideoxy-alpha-D-manno-octulosonate transaminase
MYITDQNDVKAIEELILSKDYFRNKGTGRSGHCTTFESDFAKKMNSTHALLVTSGTNALICALSSLDLQTDDEVIIPSFTFFATAVAVVNSGAIPVIVNIDDSLMIDPTEVEQAITKKTKAIIAVHMDGHACDMGALKIIADKYSLKLIEDTAQACGGSYKGKRLGSIGDIGCFSFNVDKIISCGEGGALITNNRNYYEKSLCIQDACCSFGPTFKDSFTEILPFVGQSMRVSEISGALMNVQLTRLDSILETLRIRSNILNEVFSTNEILMIKSNDQLGDCGTSINIILNSHHRVKQVFTALANSNIITFPIAARHAHASWQWSEMLEKRIPQGRYHKSQYLKSIDLLTTTLKIKVPFDMPTDETINYAEMISKVIRS